LRPRATSLERGARSQSDGTLIFIAACIILREEFRSLLHPTFTIKGVYQKTNGNGSQQREGKRNLHLVHLLEQVVIDLLAHDRIELVSRMRPDEVSDPRRWGLEFSGRTFADEIEVFEETASLAVVDI
jgi:hypothetical protein